MISKRRGTVAVIGLLPMLSCGEDSTAPPDPRPEPPRPAVVIVNPASVRLVGLGDTVQLTAEVRDQNGRTMTGVGVTWQTDDASIATVDSTGLVQAIGEGVVSIAAMAGAASGRARVEVSDPDRAVLSTFYEATGGANWKRSENWLTDAPLDQWLGVRTDEQGRVTHVHLQDNNIRGAIVPELGDLAHLTSLIIWENPLSGPIPPELGNLSQLRQLELSLDTENTLEGPIPPELGNLSLLRSFYLHADGVTGPIPPEFGQLSDLSLLSIAGEQLSGPAPRVLLRLTNLNFALLGFCLPDASDWISWAEGIATLHVSFCNEGDVSVLNTLYHGTGGPDWTNDEGWLQGPIAEWYGVTADSIGFVTALDLSHNGLAGQLPSGLGQLEHLTELSIDGNRLTGPLPLSLAGTRLRTFRYGDTDLCVPPDSTFRAWLNSIESHVGTDVQCAPSDRQVLEALYASTGGPKWKRNEHWLSDRPLGEWHGVSVDSGGRVTAIELRNNGLIGSLPLTLGSLTELRDLAIPFNGLSGPVPAQLSELAELRTLFLGHNELSGSIPPEIGELPQLRYLDLEGNRLTGELPSSLSGLDSLVAMWLERNEFTGPIPPELSDLTQLRQLKLSRNRLTGGIPPELANLVQLHQLILGSNNLTGEIPPELGNLFQLDEFDVARTDLTGELPPELGELRRLRKLDVSATGLEGEIPGNLVHLPSLELFSWSDTELCSPISRTFQDWLADIEGVRGEPCVRVPLTAFYRSAGGEGWTRNANWLTPEPVADWHGVTVDDRGLPVSLELGDNGLVGYVAPELGEFVELRALDLSGSALTGQLPGELGRLDRLRTLDISDNQFTGALPSSFVELAELASFRWDNSGACAPSASWFQNWLRSIEDQVAGAGCGEVPVLLGMPSVYLNQAVQDAGAHVPLVAGRPALLRVHATADQANEYQPRARALFFQDGAQLPKCGWTSPPSVGFQAPRNREIRPVPSAP
ncbi:Ig-like domain-containing protein [Candidatus Palauibacter sp.]|uniref:Ig-like domain-containing protein n=1 Tax=Candidatus Palauibacter sp. TaxID=3101350 RepID=UPI003B02AE56